MSKVFDYVQPTPEQSDRLGLVRHGLESLLELISATVSACAERTIAFRHLEEAGFYASKAIVRNGEKYLP